MGVGQEIQGVEAAVNRLSYLLTRTRRHQDVKLRSGISLERAATAVLLQLEGTGETRLGTLADLLYVEAPHVTRQAQLLERQGYVRRRPDATDRRAQVIELTEAGRAAASSIRAQNCEAVADALSGWSKRDLLILGGLLGRMVDDFEAHAAEERDGEHVAATAS
jgi:DNA-binding MarR family transcriptional regulator